MIRAVPLKKEDTKKCWDSTTRESIHTKDESKRVSAFAFIFGVNWPVQWDATEWQVSRTSTLPHYTWAIKTFCGNQRRKLMYREARWFCQTGIVLPLKWRDIRTPDPPSKAARVIWNTGWKKMLPSATDIIANMCKTTSTSVKIFIASLISLVKHIFSGEHPDIYLPGGKYIKMGFLSLTLEFFCNLCNKCHRNLLNSSRVLL